MRAAGFLLVGGQSLRMGRDKALLRLRSKPLVDHLADTMKAAAGTVTLVGNPEKYGHLGWPAIADAEPGVGPLGGIAAALRLGLHPLNLVVACDLPGVDIAWLARLIHRAEESNARCVVSRDANGDLQPLCGVYHSDCLPVIESMVRRRDFKVRNLTSELRAEVLDAEDIIANINTPEQWSAWLSLTQTQLQRH
jgi:molybdenum cofactor guanylyltransferase